MSDQLQAEPADSETAGCAAHYSDMYNQTDTGCFQTRSNKAQAHTE